VIHVYDNQFMMLVDGGKIIDYTAEPGYFTVDQSSSPSMFSGSLDAAVKDTFERLKFGGQTPHEQRVFYINLQEIKGIKFGTRNPVNYFDQFYNAELFLRAHGSYSIRIIDPLRFYAEAVPRNASPRRDRGYQRAVYERIFRGPAVLDQSDGSRRHPHFVRSIQERRAVPLHGRCDG